MWTWIHGLGCEVSAFQTWIQEFQESLVTCGPAKFGDVRLPFSLADRSRWNKKWRPPHNLLHIESFTKKTPGASNSNWRKSSSPPNQPQPLPELFFFKKKHVFFSDSKTPQVVFKIRWFSGRKPRWHASSKRPGVATSRSAPSWSSNLPYEVIGESLVKTYKSAILVSLKENSHHIELIHDVWKFSLTNLCLRKSQEVYFNSWMAWMVISHTLEKFSLKMMRRYQKKWWVKVLEGWKFQDPNLEILLNHVQIMCQPSMFGHEWSHQIWEYS